MVQKKKAVEKKNTPQPFVTIISGLSGFIDGVGIVRNNYTYGLMYRKNVDIRACIREISETTMKNGYELRYVQANGKEKVMEDEAFKKALGNVKDLKDAIIKNACLFANAYIQKRRDKIGRILGFKVLDSRYITIVTDSNLIPIRYLYRHPVFNGQLLEFPAKDIYHAKKGEDFDTLVYADSVLEALVVDVLGEEEANLSNYYFFKNDQIPSAIYVLKEGLDTDSQNNAMEQIRSTLKGGHNKHKAIVADSVTDVKVMKSNHDDAKFLELRKFTTEKVCAGLGVPRSILGYIEGVNLANNDGMYKKFIENTIEPWERWLEGVFTELSKDFSGYDFVINSEHIDQIEERAKIARENVANGIWTRNEGRLYIGYEKHENELADQLTIPTTQQLLDSIASADPVIPPEQLPTTV